MLLPQTWMLNVYLLRNNMLYFITFEMNIILSFHYLLVEWSAFRKLQGTNTRIPIYGAGENKQRSEDSFVGLVNIELRLPGMSSKHLHPLSHLRGPGDECDFIFTPIPQTSTLRRA